MTFQRTAYSSADTYSPIDDRWFAAGFGHSEGVAPASGGASSGGDPRTACQVQAHAPANLSVDIQAGWALVAGDDIANQGIYASYNDALLNVPMPSANPPPSGAGTSRIDLVCAKMNDSDAKVVPSGQVANEIFPFWVAGNALAGATLANPGSSPPALPASALLLAWVQVDNGASQIDSAHIADKRRFTGPLIYGGDGTVYTMRVNAGGALEIEVVR